MQTLILPDAEKKAKERQRQSEGRGKFKVAPRGATLNPSRKAIEEAASISSGLVTARTLERMEPVRRAPKTQARIDSGEIKTAVDARREALKEIGSDWTFIPVGVVLRWLGLGLWIRRLARDWNRKDDRFRQPHPPSV